ncbi:MAG TPA: hypothetical protein VKT73_11860 [Xanthobacteraceae bacterium]|nr:hypothetical protein [Xanthobacteraceae bacterium]
MPSTRSILLAAAFALQFCLPHEAAAHCFIGARFFPAGVVSDDPCVADELSLPTFSTIQMPATDTDPATRVTSYSFDYSKRITPDLGIGVGGNYLKLTPQGLRGASGWDNFSTSLKYQLYADAPHEFVLSFGLDADLGGTGAKRVGADSFSTLTPQIYAGKGFGDLPDSLAYLRPFGITGVVGYGIPTRAETLIPNGTPTPDVEFNPRMLNTSLSVQYSLPYLQSNVRDTGFASIANHLIPLVEFSFQTPVNTMQKGQTVGTINPGFVWIERYYQVSVQAIIPANSRTGNNTGVIAQLHFYLDDIFPNSIGKPIFGGRP